MRGKCDVAEFAEWQRLIAATQGQESTALAVPTGKPLSMFDSSALVAAYTDFFLAIACRFANATRQ